MVEVDVIGPLVAEQTASLPHVQCLRGHGIHSVTPERDQLAGALALP